MNTYVELKCFDNKFGTIEDAIQFAEDKELETAEIFIFSEDGTILESQDCGRTSDDEALIYYTWGIFGYCYSNTGKIEDYDILSEYIDSEKQAREIAETLKEKIERYDVVTIEHYSQTLSENIGDVDEKFEIYRMED